MRETTEYGGGHCTGSAADGRAGGLHSHGRNVVSRPPPVPICSGSRRGFLDVAPRTQQRTGGGVLFTVVARRAVTGARRTASYGATGRATERLRLFDFVQGLRIANAA